MNTSIDRDDSKRLMVFAGPLEPRSGRAHRRAARHRARRRVTLKTFANGEIYVRFEESVRGADVFLVQSTCRAGERQPHGAADHDQRRQAGLGAPHHRGHALVRLLPPGQEVGPPRADHAPSWSPTCCEAAGVDRVLTMDLHAGPDPGLLQRPGGPHDGPADARRALPRARLPGRHLAASDWSWSRRTPAAPSWPTTSPRSSAPTLAVLTKQRPEHNEAEITHADR